MQANVSATRHRVYAAYKGAEVGAFLKFFSIVEFHLFFCSKNNLVIAAKLIKKHNKNKRHCYKKC